MTDPQSGHKYHRLASYFHVNYRVPGFCPTTKHDHLLYPDDTLKLFPTHLLKLFKLFGARNQSDPSRKVRTNTCLFETTHISQLAKQWMNMDVFWPANFWIDKKWLEKLSWTFFLWQFISLHCIIPDHLNCQLLDKEAPIWQCHLYADALAQQLNTTNKIAICF